MTEVTRILSAVEQGDPSAAEQLLPLVYDELRQLAAQRLAQERPGQTLQATALVHEAYLRLVGDQKFESRGHFFAAAAEAMRRILIDSARRKGRQKRGAGQRRVDLDSADAVSLSGPDELLLLDDAIDKLAREDADAAKLVRLCSFAGLSVEQAAELLGLSRTGAYERWAYARAWLYRELRAAPPA
jgi:RNA polymerase sigma factor (TIGR02999 family)